MHVESTTLSPAVSSGAAVVHVAGHELRLFTESAPLIAAMVDDIGRARRRAWLESYILLEDAAGLAVAEVLKQKAAQGVDCRVMYDAFGSASTSSAFFRDLERAGVKVHCFHSLRQAFWRFPALRFLNRRNHRKLLVVDDQIAYFGGMNIVDQSGAAAAGRELPASVGWRDVHVRLSGRRQSRIAAAFDRLWRRVHGRRPRRWPRWPLKEMLAGEGEGLYFFDCRPQFEHRRATRVLAPLLRRARRSITLSMAYFIPQGRVLRELLRARRRGVKVRVIIPGVSDVQLAQRAARHFYDKLLSHGIQIFERKDQMLHGKTLVIDDEWSVIGSCNIDHRSLWLNLEFVAVVRSRAMAAAIKRISAFEMRRSRRVGLADCVGRGWWQRWLDRLAWSWRKWL
ncbi:MAG TPA: phosphatidylserine/phosphatidylglycerophosphate/cardiolipin synthase family protein [Pirellulales bacterium]|nr:phosphatidylserine/phosphatidylglycerophosphate/cardiolipin synthase family protein [Pirellulales bacterium]